MEKKRRSRRRSLHSLPEALLLAILSRLHSAKALAQSATVCRQWRLLCRCVDSLTFSSDELFGTNIKSDEEEFLLTQKLAAIILQTLRQSQNRCLKRLRIFHKYSFERFLSLNVWLAMWLGSLSPSSLEEIELIFCEEDDRDYFFPKLEEQSQTGLKEIFIHSNTLQRVRLEGCRILEWPLSSAPASFQQLVCVTLRQVEINDGALEDLMKACSLLEFLEVTSSIGFSNPCLVGHNLKVLILRYGSWSDSLPCVRVAAPKLERLWAALLDELNFLDRVDSPEVLFVTSPTRIRFVEPLPFLRNLEISSPPDSDSELDDFMHIIGIGKNVKHLNLDLDVTLSRAPFGFLEYLLRLETLLIGACFFQSLFDREKSPDPWLSTAPVSLPHLRRVEVDISVSVGWLHDELDDIVSTLHGLLVRLGEINDLELALCFDQTRREPDIIEKTLQLQKTFPHVKFSLLRRTTLQLGIKCFTYGNKLSYS